MTYRPSSIGEPETAEITFAHPRAGEWRYTARGVGQPPDRMDVTHVAAQLGQTASVMLAFRNPFPRPLTVSVALVPADDSDAFALLKRQAGVAVPRFGVMQVPCTFAPRAMACGPC